MKKKASMSIGGVILAVIAALFFNKGDDSNANGNTTNGSGGTQVTAPESGSGGSNVTKKVSKPIKRAASEGSPASQKPASPKPTPTKKTAPKQTPTPKPATDALPASNSRVGFTSYRSWQSHFDKHGNEFGRIDADEYLARAKALRDAPVSRRVLEQVRRDKVITRFDRTLGDFIAFHKDKSIRTFFRPNDGEAYFRRQARR
ncbi:MAG: hypothetical protein AB8H80_18185 [Planctomycetota bacterium]